MPAANFQRGRVGGKEPARENGKSGGDTHTARVPPIKLDLRDLTDKEELMIMEVIKRDERERAILDAKISEVRREIQELRKAGALVSGDDPAHMCARCKVKLAVGGAAKILPWVSGERAERCVVCKFLICPKCRSQQAKGAWTCVLCLKYRQEKLLTGEMFNKAPKPEPMGSDLLRQSLRERSRQGRRLLPAPGVVVAARARAHAGADDDLDMNAGNRDTWRRDKAKTLPSTRSASMSSQDGQPDRRHRRSSYTRSIGGHPVTVVPAKGKNYSSSSVASSSDEETVDPRRTQSTKSLTTQTKRAETKVEPKSGSTGGRRDSCSSFVSYTAESVRSNSSLNVDGSSDESLTSHQTVQQRQPVPNTQNNSIKPAYSHSSLHSRQSERQAEAQSERQAEAPNTPQSYHKDVNALKPDSGHITEKASPSFSSKFRFGRKNKSKEIGETPAKDNNRKGLLNNNKGKGSPKGVKSKGVADKNPELSAKRSNSFEEVYDSNVNRLLETMKGSSTPNLDEKKEKKPRWQDVKAKPGPTGSGGRKETLLQMALRVEKENQMLERERAERVRERAERKRLEAIESDGQDHDHPTQSGKPRRDPDNDSLTSGHLSISSRDEAGQAGGGFFSRLKTRARRKGYSQRKNSVTKPKNK